MAKVIPFVAMADLPNRLYELRRARRWSQQELADRAGISKMHVSGLERGKRDLSLSMMRRLGEALGVAPADLLSRNDNPELLADDERQLVETYRSVDQGTRDQIQRVADALSPFRHFPRDAA